MEKGLKFTEEEIKSLKEASLRTNADSMKKLKAFLGDIEQRISIIENGVSISLPLFNNVSDNEEYKFNFSNIKIVFANINYSDGKRKELLAA